MRKLVLAAALSLVSFGAIAPDAKADNIVVELYTSQGCSSCPPADKLLGDLAKKEGIIALSLHVDYWDYLGWKDVFSSPAFADRQRRYAQAAGSTMIYTPQMVIGGKDQVVGTRVMEVADALQAHSTKVSPVSLMARSSGTRAEIALQARDQSALPDEMIVQLVRYLPSETVKIERGENAGRSITYHNIVTSWNEVAVWDGLAALSIEAPLEGDAPGVVILQDGRAGPILAAVQLN